MVKKRKTPSAPRAPHQTEMRERAVSRKANTHAATMIGIEHHASADTDQYYLGDVHPDHDPDESWDELVTDPHQPALGESTGSEAVLEDEPQEGRLTPTLLKIFSRRRQQIQLSLDQLARLSGISLAKLEAFERARSGQTVTYDQAVVLSRVLGISPDELPGLRRREKRSHLGVALAELERTMLGAPLLRFEGHHGERYGGDVERAASSKAFTVRIEDRSLEPALAPGTLLGFMSGGQAQPGAILLLRHRRSALLALRRYQPPAYEGLAAWQPGYVVGGEWHVVGSLEVWLPPR